MRTLFLASGGNTIIGPRMRAADNKFFTLPVAACNTGNKLHLDVFETFEIIVDVGPPFIDAFCAAASGYIFDLHVVRVKGQKFLQIVRIKCVIGRFHPFCQSCSPRMDSFRRYSTGSKCRFNAYGTLVSISGKNLWSLLTTGTRAMSRACNLQQNLFHVDPAFSAYNGIHQTGWSFLCFRIARSSRGIG